jgi:hypothetical protein
MIGRLIYSILSSDAALTALVPATKIFPYVLNENTDLPAIVYGIRDVSPEYTKDGWSLDNIEFTVVVITPSYSDLQDIAVIVRDAMELFKGTVGTTTIQRIQMTGMNEQFLQDVNVFTSEMSFNVNVINY